MIQNGKNERETEEMFLSKERDIKIQFIFPPFHR